MKNKLSNYGIVEENVSLKNYNTFKIGGICKYMVHPRTEDEVKNLFEFLKKENIKYFLLGNGSNVIINDELYDGVIVKLDQFQKIIFDGVNVFVDAGVMMPKLAMESIHHGLTGFEWAVGIPGTVGGCIFGNAEAYKVSTFDNLADVTVLTPDGEIKTYLKNELSHAYRTSFFKENPGYVILSAHFCLEEGNLNESMEKVNHRREKRVTSQPLEFPSAGSVFRNPGPEIYSGKLIEDLGLKGKIIGGAEVSQKHANFIINRGKATSKDIRNLIELVHQNVLERYNIDLKMEQEYVGWD